MASLPDAATDSLVVRQHRHDLSRTLRPLSLSQEPGDGIDMGPFPRGPRSGITLRRQFFLHGVPLHAGA